MANYPGSSGGSDLPRPRKNPAQPPSGNGNRAKKPAPPKQAAPAKKPAAAPQQRPSSRSNENRRPKTYSNDTMELPVQPYADDYAYDDGYDAPPKPARPQPRKAAQGTVKKRKKRKHTSFLGGLFKKLAAIVAVIFLIYSAAALFMISRLEKLPREERIHPSAVTLDAPHVTSILLIGTDARDAAAERGRSDSMILVSINSSTKNIYLSSFMRDAYVEIPGHGSNKLNAAYSFGGAELLMDTLEQNYGVSIDDYMCVSFSGFAGVIDAFGGVEITMSDAEAKALNDILISEVNELLGDAREADLLPGGGTFTLNGKQALCYSRIRYVGNADFERTSRQREVMSQLFGNLKTRVVTAVPELVSSALPNVGTNMSTLGLYGLSLRAPFVLGYDIRQQQIPADGTWSGQTVDGQSVLVVDFAKNTEFLRDTVYAAETQDTQSVTEGN